MPETKIVDSTTGYAGNDFYNNDLILTDGCESRTDYPTANYYMTDNGVADAFITLDLGCEVFITNVQLKNGHNINYNK